MYMMLFAAAIVLRYRMRDSDRPFRLGGNFTMWIIAGLGFCGSLLAFILSFIPPAQISTGDPKTWVTILIVGCIIVVVVPFIIYAMRKPSWKSSGAEFAPFHWEK
jgi:amino acid transporter